MKKLQTLIPLIFCVLILPQALLSAGYSRCAAKGIGDDEQPPKAVIKSKPEPRYPKEARKHKIEAIIILRAVFTSSGQVTNIKFYKAIPEDVSQDFVDEFTKRSIEAARKIKFEPARKDGHPVSMYVQLEYNFRLD